MAFKLDNTFGNGRGIVKVSADINTTGQTITKRVSVKVNGIIKKAVTLIQHSLEGYDIFITSDVTTVPNSGGNVKITYWAEASGTVLPDVLNLTGVVNQVNSGKDSSGKSYVIDSLPENTSDSQKSYKYTVSSKDLSKSVTITQDKAESLIVHCTVNTDLIPVEGGTFEVLYWASRGSTIISSGVNLEKVPSLWDELVYNEVSADVFEGKNRKRFSVNKNDSEGNKLLTLKATYQGIDSPSVTLKQSGKVITVLPDFDFLTFKYSWKETDGKDLDSITQVVGSKLPIGNGHTLDEYAVGYGLSALSNSNQLNGKDYLVHGGDNTNSGDEGALINLKSILDNEAFNKNTDKIYINIYANWYASKADGNMSVQYNMYRGTGMIKDSFTFKPDSSTSLISTVTLDTVCKSVGGSCNTHPEVVGGDTISETIAKAKAMTAIYSNIAVLEYDVKGKYGMLKMVPKQDMVGYSIGLTGKVNGGNRVANRSVILSSTERYEKWQEASIEIPLTEYRVTVLDFKDSDEGQLREIPLNFGSASYFVSYSIKRNTVDETPEQVQSEEVTWIRDVSVSLKGSEASIKAHLLKATDYQSYITSVLITFPVVDVISGFKAIFSTRIDITQTQL